MADNYKPPWETAIPKKLSHYGFFSDAILTLESAQVRPILTQRILDIEGHVEIAAFSHNIIADKV